MLCWSTKFSKFQIKCKLSPKCMRLIDWTDLHRRKWNLDAIKDCNSCIPLYLLSCININPSPGYSCRKGTSSLSLYLVSWAFHPSHSQSPHRSKYQVVPLRLASDQPRLIFIEIPKLRIGFQYEKCSTDYWQCKKQIGERLE